MFGWMWNLCAVWHRKNHVIMLSQCCHNLQPQFIFWQLSFGKTTEGIKFSLFVSICLSICLSIYLSIYPSIYSSQIQMWSARPNHSLACAIKENKMGPGPISWETPYSQHLSTKNPLQYMILYIYIFFSLYRQKGNIWKHFPFLWKIQGHGAVCGPVEFEHFNKTEKINTHTPSMSFVAIPFESAWWLLQIFAVNLGPSFVPLQTIIYRTPKPITSYIYPP